MSPEELSLSLSGIILSEGIEDSVIETLSKSRRGGGEVPQESVVRTLLSRWKGFFRQLLGFLKRNIDLWIEAKRTTGPRGWWFFASPEIKNDLQLRDLQEAEELVFLHFKAAAGLITQGLWGTNYEDLWASMGLEVPPSYFFALAREAYESGRAKSAPRVADYAGLHAGSYVVGLGSKVANRVLQRGLVGLQGNYRGTIGYLVNRDQEIDHWGRLSNLMKEVISDSQWKREMDRISNSEVRWAYNIGLLQNYIEQGYSRVQYRVQPTACANCKRLLLQPDGKPKVFPVRNLLLDIGNNGGTNSYRDEQDWKPTALIHPHCHCSLMPYDEGKQ